MDYSTQYQVLRQICITLIVRNHKQHSTKHKIKVIVIQQSLWDVSSKQINKVPTIFNNLVKSLDILGI